MNKATPARVVYLHGFASGPRSAKTLWLNGECERLGLTLSTLDLNLPRFSRLSLAAMAGMICYLLADGRRRTFVIASSLGTAALLRALCERPELCPAGVALLAPVVDHRAALRRLIGADQAARWRAAGTHEFQHYAAGRPLPVWHGIMAEGNPLDPGRLRAIECPVLVLTAADDAVADPAEAGYLAHCLPNATASVADTDHRFARGSAGTWASIESFFGIAGGGPARFRYGQAGAGELAGPVTDEAVSVLTRAYGDRSHAPAVHHSRILGEDSVLVWARDTARPGEPMAACSYVRPDGKWGAVGVLPGYQGLGLACSLSRLSQSLVYPQFVEVDSGRERPRRMALSAGFRPVYHEPAARRILARAGHRIRPTGRDCFGIQYMREHKAPGPPRLMQVFTNGLFGDDGR
jgi:uncharacterized protein